MNEVVFARSTHIDQHIGYNLSDLESVSKQTTRDTVSRESGCRVRKVWNVETPIYKKYCIYTNQELRGYERPSST